MDKSDDSSWMVMSAIAFAVLGIVLLIPSVITPVGLVNYRIDDRHVRVYWGSQFAR